MDKKFEMLVSRSLPNLSKEVADYFLKNPDEAARRLAHSFNNTIVVDLCVQTRIAHMLDEEGFDCYLNTNNEKDMYERRTIEIHKVSLMPFVDREELQSRGLRGLSVDEMLRRADMDQVFDFGASQGQALVKEQHMIPVEWREWKLILPGNVWQEKGNSKVAFASHLNWSTDGMGHWNIMPDYTLAYGYDERCCFLFHM